MATLGDTTVTSLLSLNGITASTFSGNGASLTNLNGSNISSGTVAFARLPTGTGANQVAIGNHTHSSYAIDSDVVHKTGDETITGTKTFKSTSSNHPQLIFDGPYDATSATKHKIVIKDSTSQTPNLEWFLDTDMAGRGTALVAGLRGNASFDVKTGNYLTIDSGRIIIGTPVDSVYPNADSSLSLGTEYNRWKDVHATTLKNGNATYGISIPSTASYTANKTIALDEDVVHKTGNENINGTKYFVFEPTGTPAATRKISLQPYESAGNNKIVHTNDNGTTNYKLSLPNKSGTLAITDDIPSTYAGSSSAGGAANSVANSLTFNNGGSGAASGTTFNGSAAKTISYNTIGAAAASHGHAATTYQDTRDTNHSPTDTVAFNGVRIDFKNKSTSSIPSTGTWTAIMTMDGYSDSSGGYPHQLGFSMSDTGDAIPLYHRSAKSSTEWGSWKKILDSGNWSSTITLSSLGAADDSTVVHLTGTEAISGKKTFSNAGGIDISNAGATATLSVTNNSESGEMHISGVSFMYLPLMTSTTMMRLSEIWANNNNTLVLGGSEEGILTLTNGSFSTSSYNNNVIYKTNWHNGSTTAVSAYGVQFPDTHGYTANRILATTADIPSTYAGSSSAGGAATSANKLNTNAGNSTQPVYFSNGVPVACTIADNSAAFSGIVRVKDDGVAEVGRYVDFHYTSTVSDYSVRLETPNATTITAYLPSHEGTIAVLNATGQTGTFYATSFYATSDRRLKENIKNSNLNYLDIINKLHLKEFNFKDQEDKENKYLGLIAQQVVSVLPEKYKKTLVSTPINRNDKMSINEGKIPYITMGAVQQLSKKVDKQEKEINRLKQENKELKQKLKQIEKKLDALLK